MFVAYYYHVGFLLSSFMHAFQKVLELFKKDFFFIAILSFCYRHIHFKLLELSLIVFFLLTPLMLMHGNLNMQPGHTDESSNRTKQPNFVMFFYSFFTKYMFYQRQRNMKNSKFSGFL